MKPPTDCVPQEEPEFFSMIFNCQISGRNHMHNTFDQQKRAGLGKYQCLAYFSFGQMNTKCWLSSAYLPWLLRYLFRGSHTAIPV